jgi:hypothetical protein
MPVVVAPSLLASRSSLDSASTSEDSFTSIDDAPPKFPSPNSSQTSLPTQNHSHSSPTDDEWIINVHGRRAPKLSEVLSFVPAMFRRRNYRLQRPLTLATPVVNIVASKGTFQTLRDSELPMFICADPFYPQRPLVIRITRDDILKGSTDVIHMSPRCGREVKIRIQLVD